MPMTLHNPLVIAMSPRTILAKDDGDDIPALDISSSESLSSQESRVSARNQTGPAFPFVRKMLALNGEQQQIKPCDKYVEAVIVSEDTPLSASRHLNRARHAGLPIERSIATGGRDAIESLAPLHPDLYLSTDDDKVRRALHSGYPAARIPPQMEREDAHPQELRIAFDFDGVLAGDELERVYAQDGLPAAHLHETEKQDHPLPPGPLLPFAQALERVKALPARSEMSIRTGLFTARSAPSNERAMQTLTAYDVMPDEAMFLGGLSKGPFLQSFAADIFFDDQIGHVENALPVTMASHVPYGVRNMPTAPNQEKKHDIK